MMSSIQMWLYKLKAAPVRHIKKHYTNNSTLAGLKHPRKG
jgi:hypothetical protein